MLFKITVALIIGYLAGNIQTSYFLGKTVRHQDIRNYGSGNAGATNAFRVFGVKLGLLTFFGDFLKAFVVVVLTKYYLGGLFVPLLAGIAVVVGHNWPFVLKFHGGKGIAATIGLFYGLDWRVGLLMTVVLALTIIITRYVSLGSLLLAVAVPVVVFIFHSQELALVALSSVLTLMAFYQHRANIARLRNGTENKLVFKK